MRWGWITTRIPPSDCARTGERLWQASVHPRALKEERAKLARLVHQARVLKSRYHRGLALDACIRDRANLLAVEVVPATAVILAHEWYNGAELDEIDERIAHIALVLEVDGEVEEVVRSLEVLVDLLENSHLRTERRGCGHGCKSERKSIATRNDDDFLDSPGCTCSECFES